MLATIMIRTTLSLLLVSLSLFACGQKKSSKPVPAKKTVASSSFDCGRLPYSAVPEGLAGDWASGFSSFTQIVDVYTGKHLQAAWQSGKFFRFHPNGKDAEFYYMADGFSINTSTYATGTVKFAPGSTAQKGSFTFYACKAHYNGWEYGKQKVNRDATAEECKTLLTETYHYVEYNVSGVKEYHYLRIEKGGLPNEYTASFSKLD